MPQSFKKRIEGLGIKPQEVVDYARDWGPFEAGRAYGCTPITMDKFLIMQTGDPNITRRFCVSSMGNKPLSSAIVDELLLRCSTRERDNENLTERIMFQQKQIELLQRKDKNDALEFLKTLRLSQLPEAPIPIGD